MPGASGFRAEKSVGIVSGRCADPGAEVVVTVLPFGGVFADHRGERGVCGSAKSVLSLILGEEMGGDRSVVAITFAGVAVSGPDKGCAHLAG